MSTPVFSTPTPQTRAASIVLWIFFALQVLSLILLFVSLSALDALGGLALVILLITLAITVFIGILAAKVTKGDRRAAGMARNVVIVLAVLSLLNIATAPVQTIISVAIAVVVIVFCHRAATT